jgi:hypothetical protein
VARTVADLAGERDPTLRLEHVSTALALRAEPAWVGRVA